MTLSVPPLARDSVRPEGPPRPTLLVPPAPERGSVPSWHLALALRPLAPPPSDLADSLDPPRAARASGARARADTPRRPARGEALSTAATIACALLLGGLFGLSVGQALRHRAHAPAASSR